MHTSFIKIKQSTKLYLSKQCSLDSSMFIKLYALALPVFFAIDMLWLGIVAKGFYAQQLGHLMRPSINWGAAVLFYLLFIVGLIVFAITPAIEKESLIHAVF